MQNLTLSKTSAGTLPSAVATNSLCGIGVEIEMPKVPEHSRHGGARGKSLKYRTNEFMNSLVLAGDAGFRIFLERADIQLLRPGGRMLEMQLPEGLSDRAGIEHAVFTELVERARK